MRVKRLHAAVLLLLGALVWATGIDGVFLYDDYDSITLNPHIHQLWPLTEAMSRPLAGAAETVSTRPLLSLTFAVDYALHGLTTTGYHVVNIAIHLACALLLLAFLRRTLLLPRAPASTRAYADGLAFTIALLWMLHPLQTSAVTYIVQRAEALGAFFILLALYCGLRAAEGEASIEAPSRAQKTSLASPRTGIRSDVLRHPAAGAWSLAAIAACWLGAGAKETVAAAPILALVHHATFVDGSYRRALARRWPLYAGMAASWTVLWVLSAPDTAELAGRGYSYALTQPGVLLYYLRLVLWPHPLAMSYDWPAAAPASALVPGIVVVALVALTTWGVVARRWWGFAGAVFFGVLAPSSSVFDLTQRIMEHRMYLPSAVVVALAVLGAHALLRRFTTETTPATNAARGHRSDPRAPAATSPGALATFGTPSFALVTLVAVALAATTIARNRDYADEIAFWQENVAAQPSDSIAQLQLGRAYLRRDDNGDARASFERAVALGPPFAPVYNDLARTLIAQEDLDAADAALDRALELDPDLAVAHNNRGIVEERRGNSDDAIASYRRALALDPQLAIARDNLARVLAASGSVDAAAAELERTGATVRAGSLLEHAGRLDEAQARYEKAVAGNPADLTAANALATLLARRGRFDEAERRFGAVLARDPDNLDALRNLGALEAMRGHDAEAMEHLHRVLALDPDAARVRFNLGLLYEKTGDLERATDELSGEVAVSPDFAPAHAALGRVLEKAGHRDRALAEYEAALRLAPDLVEAREGLQRARRLPAESGS